MQLVRDLGLSTRGNCLDTIRDHAFKIVSTIIENSPVPVDCLETLRRVVANKYRARLEVISSDEDVHRIAEDYSDFHPHLKRRLSDEFLAGATEGITLERDPYDAVAFRYLIVVDARGERAARAHFTAWHEITHLVVHPQQLRFPGFRRTPLYVDIEKDPLESVVDHVAGKLAFYKPLFGPVIQRLISGHEGLTFDTVEAARIEAAPTASLFATAVGSLDYASRPTLFVSVGLGLKKGERRLLRSPQQTFGFARVEAQEKLRLLYAIPNEVAAKSDLALRRNMRVPQDSVLSQAFASAIDVTLDANEDQGSWETSDEGALPPLDLKVQAIRRGRYVYGLIASC